MPGVHVCVSHLVEHASHMGHEAMEQRVMVMMVVHMMMLMLSMMRVVCVRAMLSGMMFLFVHMYMKLLYLWNAPLYSET